MPAHYLFWPAIPGGRDVDRPAALDPPRADAAVARLASGLLRHAADGRWLPRPLRASQSDLAVAGALRTLVRGPVHSSTGVIRAQRAHRVARGGVAQLVGASLLMDPAQHPQRRDFCFRPLRARSTGARLPWISRPGGAQYAG